MKTYKQNKQLCLYLKSYLLSRWQVGVLFVFEVPNRTGQIQITIYSAHMVHKSICFHNSIGLNFLVHTKISQVKYKI